VLRARHLLKKSLQKNNLQTMSPPKKKSTLL
jgi:hypothetical protein